MRGGACDTILGTMDPIPIDDPYDRRAYERLIEEELHDPSRLDRVKGRIGDAVGGPMVGPPARSPEPSRTPRHRPCDRP